MLTVGALSGLAFVTSCGSGTGAMMGGVEPGSSSSGWSMMGGVPLGCTMRNLTCTGPTALRGSTVRVFLGDMGMTRMMGGVAPLGGHMMLRATPDQVPAGQVTFLVANMGWRTHEMVVLPLAAGQVDGQRQPGKDGRVSETGSLGEASATCAQGAGDGIQSGSMGWVTLHLKAGSYELVCNLPNHYADGMHQQIVVK